jgi:hypothetical protein
LNDEYFVVVDTGGTYAPPGGVPRACTPGDWFLSDGTQWVFFDYKIGSVSLINTGAGLSGGPITSTGTISVIPATTSAIGGVIPDGSTITVNSAGVISAASSPSQKFVYLDDISSQFNNTATLFTLSASGLPYTPVPSSNILVTVGGVPQPYGTAYSVSGSSILFSAPPSTGTSFLAVTVA